MATNNAINLKSAGVVYYDAAGTFTGVSTSTANQALLSGSNVAPSWSTATYPATTTANQLLYSSATNTIAGLSSANSSVLVTTSAGVPGFTSSLTNGQTILGSTSGTPVAGTITGSNGITVTTGAGTLALSGQVVQTVSTANQSGSTTTSTSYVDVTNATATITPTSASNRVRVTISFVCNIASIGGANHIAYYQILRGATNLTGTDNLLNQATVSAGGIGGNWVCTWDYIDSPATTSATTYKLQQRSNTASGSVGVNLSTVTLQEIV